jgi:hypothetical protein
MLRGRPPEEASATVEHATETAVESPPWRKLRMRRLPAKRLLSMLAILDLS